MQVDNSIGRDNYDIVSILKFEEYYEKFIICL